MRAKAEARGCEISNGDAERECEKAQWPNEAKLVQRNSLLRADIQDLKIGLEAIEERARNDLGLIKQGETFNQKNLGLRRPGNGLAPALLERVLGLKASKNIHRGVLIDMGDMSGV